MSPEERIAAPELLVGAVAAAFNLTARLVEAQRREIGIAMALGMPRRRIAIRPLLVAMLFMMTGTLVQIALWGALFVALGEFDEYYEAVYHSAVNFASLGYGDIVMTKKWKLLGPLEAVNGVLMLGMSAAALMVILQHMIKAQRDLLGQRND